MGMLCDVWVCVCESMLCDVWVFVSLCYLAVSHQYYKKITVTIAT